MSMRYTTYRVAAHHVNDWPWKRALPVALERRLFGGCGVSHAFVRESDQGSDELMPGRSVGTRSAPRTAVRIGVDRKLE